MDGSSSLPAADGEAQPPSSGHKRGGWVTIPFLTATMAGLTLAAGGWMNNLIVYMIGEFNAKSINSAQIWNIVNGCTTMFPVIGAIVADSYLGCFSVICISSLISLLGIVLLMLTATLDSLRPPPCDNNTGSSLCSSPSKFQYAILYTSLALAILGVSGTRFTIGTMGANQFDKPKHRDSFWNWFIFTMYTSSAISGTVIVYVEDNVSWGWGFGICAVANILGLAIFVFGSRFYRHFKPQGSPFMGLARVVVAAIQKRNVLPSIRGEDYYYHKQLDGDTKIVAATLPTQSFNFLNRAAQKTEGDIRVDGSIAKLWRLCAVQQVEDLKTLIRIFPLWSTGIFLTTPLAIQTSLATLQALTVDRHIGPHFKVPAGSMIVFILVSTSISIVIIDRCLYPMWKKLTGRDLTPLQRIGIGHVVTVLSMVVSAVVESKRLKTVQSHHLQNQNGSILPMSVLWLVPQLALAGIGEAFHFPGNVAFYYQEFPVSLKSTSTALVALFIGIAFYLSTAVVGVVRRTTQWLPDNINDGRMDNVYWVLGVIGTVNFGYYLVCAWLYKYQDVDNVVDGSDE